MTIGDPKETGRTNPNGADGVGLEYFGAGSDPRRRHGRHLDRGRLRRHLRRLTRDDRVDTERPTRSVGSVRHARCTAPMLRNP